MRLRLSIAALVALALATWATPAEAAFPGQNGKIAYACGGICTINPDGTGETKLVADGSQPAWSPDGEKIAFTVFKRDQYDSYVGDIYVMNADGTGVTQLTTYALDDRDPAWSPDGTKIVFARLQRDVYFFSHVHLYTMNPDGTQPTQLTSDPTFDYSPSWDPSGSRIAYKCGDSDICVIHPDGSGRTDLGFGSNPDWSPDGSKIAFETYRIFTMNPDGTGRTQISSPSNPPICDFLCGIVHDAPAWAPDGTKIAFRETAFCIGGSHCIGPFPIVYPSLLLTVNPDGTDTHLVTRAGAQPSWQPVLPKPEDFKNVSEFCKAERERLGEHGFKARYSSNANAANAFGQCVSANSSSR